MTAIGQLWHRAPLWRAALVVACASTGLAAIYSDGLFKQQQVKTGTSSYTPATAPPPATLPAARPPAASIASPVAMPTGIVPAFGESFRGTVTLLGHLLPLPAGDWTVVGVNQAKQPSGQQTGAVMLARSEASQLLGAILAFSGDGAGPPAGFSADYTCQGARVLAARIYSAEDHGRQDNWCVDLFNATTWDGPQQPSVLRAGAGALRQRGVDLPQLMFRSYFVETDKASYLKVNYFLSTKLGGFADPALKELNLWTLAGMGQSPERMAFFVRMGNWTARWHSLILRTFARQLTAPEVTANLAEVH